MKFVLVARTERTSFLARSSENLQIEEIKKMSDTECFEFKVQSTALKIALTSVLQNLSIR